MTEPPKPLWQTKLTPREVEVCLLVAEGFGSLAIGERLKISHRTVEEHRINAMAKLRVTGVVGLVRKVLGADP